MFNHALSVYLDSRITTRVFTIFKVNFQSLDAAEEHYNLTLSNRVEKIEAGASRINVLNLHADLLI